MKISKSLRIAALLALLSTQSFGQSTHKGYPLLRANSSKVSVRIGDVLVNGLWTIKPQFNPNSLHIQVAGQKERLTFYTDIDSAMYEISPVKSEQFYVLLNKEHYVFTEVKGFKRDSEQREKRFLEIEKPRSKVFGTLWERHHIGDVVEGINNYAGKASSTVNWVKGKLQSSD